MDWYTSNYWSAHYRISPAGPHIFDAITAKIVEKITVLIDIEATSTTLLIGGKFDHLTSHKLPFGYSLYISDDLKKSRKNYFDRIMNSVDLILKKLMIKNLKIFL